MKKKSVALFVAKTGMLLALTIFFQLLRLIFPGLAANPSSQFIIGSLVNLGLFLSANYVGLWSGIAIAIVTPIVAFITGVLPIVPLVPIVCAGNAVLVIVFCILIQTFRKLWSDKNQLAANIISIVAASVLKFVVLLVLVKYVAVLFVNEKQFANLAIQFLQFNQLITAGIGGFLFLLIKPVLDIANKHI